MTQPTRLLVVGSAGFLGSSVVNRAVGLGWDVTGLSLRRHDGWGPPGVRVVSVDVTDGGALREALGNAAFEYVVNCSGYVDHAMFFKGGRGVFDTHLRSVMNLVETLDRGALQAFVNIGSSDAYGNTAAPQEETQREAPISPYSAGKVAATHFLQMLCRTEKFPATVLRLFLSYGPGQDERRFLPQVILGCLEGRAFPASKGEQLRDLCFVEDAVDAVMATLVRPTVRGEVINIASGQPVSVRQIIETIRQLVGRGQPQFGDLAYRPGENMALYADISKARTLLGWEPKVPLRVGLEKTIQWIRARHEASRAADGAGTPYHWGRTTPTTRGEPEKLIRLSKPCLGAAEKRAVQAVLDREFLGMGAEVQQFEQVLTEFFGRPAVCVVNGTAALHLAVQACGIGPGDEVLVPSLTYVASFQAVSATGAKPVACDIDPETCLLDWHDAERRVTPRTKAVMPVHYTGGLGDLEGFRTFAQRHGLRVIEDAAHALGGTYGGKRVGSFGDIACFSFDGIKNITSGEGGCVVTDDASVLRKIQDARLLGVEKDTEKRYTGRRSWEFDVTARGWRYHMSSVMAAIGLEQFKRFAEMAAARQRLARSYDERLRSHPRIRPLPHDYDTVVPHIYVVRIQGAWDRPAARARLLERGIQTGIHYQPNHVLSLYRDPAALPLPATEAVFPELLTLPLHPDVTEQDVEFICTQLQAVLHD